ncbi:hypothetical protein [Aquimarina pacifica]|nr:hypothetical protein [Aquimarina pacifica]
MRNIKLSKKNLLTGVTKKQNALFNYGVSLYGFRGSICVQDQRYSYGIEY